MPEASHIGGSYHQPRCVTWPSRAFDAILASRLPAFSEAEAVTVAERDVRHRGRTATNLGSERDQTFLLQGPAGNAWRS